MKTFLVLYALVTLAESTAMREKRGLVWGEQSHGWQSGLQPGWQSGGWHDQPKIKIITVKKLVHVQREVTVPQVVHVHKVIIVKKELPVQHGHHGG